MAIYTRTTTIDSGPTGDSVKQAVLDLDTDLTGIVAAYDVHDVATTSVHGFTGSKTGSGAMVGANTPTLITPVIGVATATSINKVAITAPATASTLTIAEGKTLTANATMTLTGTDATQLSLAGNLTTAGAYATTLTTTNTTSVTLPTSGTLVSSVTTGNGVSASNTAGALAFSLGVITPTSVNGITLAGGTNTFSAAVGTASLDVAAGATVDVNANLTVESTSTVNQDLTTDASPTFAAIKLTTGAGANKVLTSDADGDATWSAASTAATAAEINTGTETAKYIAPDQLVAYKVGYPAVSPHNLVENASLELPSDRTTAVPTGWALEVTPTLATDTGAPGCGALSQKITAAGAATEGIAYTIAAAKLKPSTTYTVSWMTKVTAGDTSQVLTTGAGTDMTATESTSETWESKVGTFITDATPTAVVLKLMAKTDGDVVWFDGVKVTEGKQAHAFNIAEAALGAANMAQFMNAAGTGPEWSRGVKIGSFTRDTGAASGDVAYTGVGFKPSQIIFIGCENTINSKHSIGFDDGTNHWCYQGVYSTPGLLVSDATVSILLQQDAGRLQKGLIKTFDADGFTITWTLLSDPSGNALVTYIAFR